MPSVTETIPEALQGEVSAALAWFNASQDTTFEVTGIVDAEQSLAETGTRDLRLVLCGGDRCLQESFRVQHTGDGYQVTPLQTDGATEAEDKLDPPPGKLSGWLDKVLPQHEFTLLLFYRGFW
jgi:hypothetical protein